MYVSPFLNFTGEDNAKQTAFLCDDLLCDVTVVYDSDISTVPVIIQLFLNHQKTFEIK